MASENNYYSGIWSLAFFLIFSTIFLGISMVIIVATNDYLIYQFYEVASDMVTQGFLSADILSNFETFSAQVIGSLVYLDKIWAVTFVMFVITFLQNSYMSKREGYFSVFGFMSFGIMLSLFLLDLIVTYNDKIYDIFFNVLLENLTVELTLFSFYISNFQIINLILIVLGLIVNFVPFDVELFNGRKDDDLKEVS